MIETKTALKYYLEIKEPCHESWEKMSPTDKGKFCSSCEKEVIDFTKINDRDILSVLKNAERNVCGRIQKERLNNSIETENSKSTFKNVKQLAASFLLLNFVLDSSKELKGQNVSDTIVINDTRWKGQPEVITNSVSERIIRGTIKDDTTGEILYGASIMIKGTKQGATVDYSTEEFVLRIPSTTKDTIELEFYYVTYDSKSIKYSLNNLPEEITIALHTNLEELHIVGLIEPYPARKKPIRRFFRRIFNPSYFD